MASSIELPQFWIQLENEEKNKIFYHKLYKQYIHYHPGIEYFRLILQKARQISMSYQSQDSDLQNENNPSFLYQEQKLMSFIDKIGRPYSIDIEEYMNLQYFQQSQQNNVSPTALYSYYDRKLQQSVDATNNQQELKSEYKLNLKLQKGDSLLTENKQSLNQKSQIKIELNNSNTLQPNVYGNLDAFDNSLAQLIHLDYSNQNSQQLDSSQMISSQIIRNQVNEDIENKENIEKQEGINQQIDDHSKDQQIDDHQKDQQIKQPNSMFEAMMQYIWKNQEEEIKSVNNQNLLRETIFNSQYYYQPKDYDGDDEDFVKNDLIENIPVKLIKRKRKNSNLCDEHLLVLSSQLNIKLPEKIHILQLIHEYLTIKENSSSLTNPWRFRINEDKEYFWINKTIKKSQNSYPFLGELKTIIDIFEKSVNHKVKFAKLKHNYDNIFSYFEDGVDKQQAIEAIQSYSKKLVQQFYNCPFQDTQTTIKQPLKQLMELMRSDKEIDEEKIKNDILFQWKYSLQYPFQPKQMKDNKIQHTKQLLKGPSPVEIITNPLKYSRFQVEGYYFSSSDYISSETSSSSSDSSEVSDQSEEAESISSVSDEEDEKIQESSKNILFEKNKSFQSQPKKLTSMKTTDISMNNFTDNETTSVQGISRKNGISSNYDEESSQSSSEDKEQEENQDQQVQFNLEEKSITRQGGGDDEQEHQETDSIIKQLNKKEEIEEEKSEVSSEKLDEIKELVKITEEQINTTDLNQTKADQSSFNNHLDDSTKISLFDQSINDSLDIKFNLQPDEIKESNDSKLFENYNSKLQTIRSSLLEKKEKEQKEQQTIQKSEQNHDQQDLNLIKQSNPIQEILVQEKKDDLLQKQIAKQEKSEKAGNIEVQDKGDKEEKQIVKNGKLKMRQKSRELQKKLKNIVEKYKPDESILVNMKNALKKKTSQEGERKKTENNAKGEIKENNEIDHKHKRMPTNITQIQKKTQQQRLSLQYQTESKQSPLQFNIDNRQQNNKQIPKIDVKNQEIEQPDKQKDKVTKEQKEITADKQSKKSKSKQKKDESKSKSRQKKQAQQEQVEGIQQQNEAAQSENTEKQIDLKVESVQEQQIETKVKLNQETADQSSFKENLEKKNQDTKVKFKNVADEKQIKNEQNSKEGIQEVEKQQIEEKRQDEKLNQSTKNEQEDQQVQSEDQNSKSIEQKLLHLFSQSKKHKKHRPQRVVKEDEIVEKQKKTQDSPRQRISLDVQILGDLSPKDQNQQRNSITGERRRSSILKNSIDSSGSFSDSIKEDNIPQSKTGFFNFHQNKQQNNSSKNSKVISSQSSLSSLSSQETFQVLRIKNNYNIEDSLVVLEEDGEEFAENENQETLKNEEQNRKERKRNNFYQKKVVGGATTATPGVGVNSIKDPLIKAQLDNQYRHMSIFQSQGVQANNPMQKKKFNNWREKVQFAIEAAKVKEEFTDNEKDVQFEKIDERYPKSYQFWRSEQKSKQSSQKAFQLLETIEKQNQLNQKSVLLSDFMPKKSELSTAFTKFDAVKINQESVKQFNLQQEIQDLKNKEGESDQETRQDYQHYSYITKEFYDVNLPSLINHYQKLKQTQNQNSQNDQKKQTTLIESNVQPNFYFPIIPPLRVPQALHKSAAQSFRSESASPSRNKLIQQRKLEMKLDRNNNQNDDNLEGENKQIVINEIEEERFNKIKDNVTNRINFYFKNNLRLHFLEKQILEKEEEKQQRSLKLIQFKRNLLNIKEEDQLKDTESYTNKLLSPRYTNQSFLKNGIEILKQANRLNRSLSPKTINNMRSETTKLTQNTLPSITINNNQNNNNQLQSKQTYKTFPNQQITSLGNGNQRQLPQIFFKENNQMSRSLDKSPRLKPTIKQSNYYNNITQLNTTISQPINYYKNNPINVQNLQLPDQKLTNTQRVNNSNKLKQLQKQEDDKLKIEMHSLSKFEDNYTLFKLKQALEKLTSSRDKIYKTTNFYNQINEVGQFSLETQQQLRKLQLKFFKQKLDMLIFDIIVCGLNLTKEAKKLIVDSEVLQSRFYSKFRKYFSIIRDEILSMQIIKENQMKILADPSFDICIIDEIYKQVQDKCQNIFLEMKTINVLEATILYSMKKQANQHIQIVNARNKQNEEKNKQLSQAQGENLKSEMQLKSIDNQEEEEEKSNNLYDQNTFLDQSEDSGQEDEYDDNPFKIQSNFFILNSQLFTDYLINAEQQSAGVRVYSSEKKEFLSKIETKQQIQIKINNLKKLLSKPESINLLQRFLKNQQEIEQSFRVNRMFQAQQNQLGKFIFIHSLFIHSLIFLFMQQLVLTKQVFTLQIIYKIFFFILL